MSTYKEQAKEWHASEGNLMSTNFREPYGKYWNEFYRKWLPDPERKDSTKKTKATP